MYVRSSFCVASAVVLVCAFSTGGPLDVSSNLPADAGPCSLSGYVLKGPVSGATVSAFKLHSDLTSRDALATEFPAHALISWL